VEEERTHRLRRLAAAYRVFSRFGFDDGINGHLTVRDPERSDHFWVAPLGVPFSRTTVRDLVRVDADGRVVEGDLGINEAAFAIHSRIHAARPDVAAACHAHTTWGRTWSTTGRLLEPLTQDACAFYGDHAVYDDYTGVVLDPDEGDRIAASLGPGKAVILRNHGLLTVGRSIDEAAWWFITMERCCQVQVEAERLDGRIVLSHEVASRTAGQVGTAQEGWHSFQPIYDRIVAEQPDLLDA
jgi:ribulose-5-phosphate 4-epimerase/fuculose-1-phosphate aldolase